MIGAFKFLLFSHDEGFVISCITLLLTFNYILSSKIDTLITSHTQYQHLRCCKMLHKDVEPAATDFSATRGQWKKSCGRNTDILSPDKGDVIKKRVGISMHAFNSDSGNYVTIEKMLKI